MLIIQLCGEKLCIDTAYVSIEVPGMLQRCYLCRSHYEELKKTAKEIDLPLEGLNVRLIGGEERAS